MVVMPVSSWTDFKTLVTRKSLLMQYQETDTYYDVFISESDTYIWNVTLLKDGGADVSDFETNHKPSANRAIHSDGDFRNLYSYQTGNGTTVVKIGHGVLRSVLVNDDNTGGTISVYDNTAGSGTKILELQLGTPSGGLLSSTGVRGAQLIGPLGIEFTTGLTVVRAGSTNNKITILYR